MKFNYGLSIVSLVILILANIPEGRAQTWDDWRFFKVFSSEEYDDTRALYVGFTVPSLSVSHYVIKKTPNWRAPSVQSPTREFSYIASGSGIEVGVGIPVRFRVNHYLSVLSGVDFPNLLYLNSLEYNATGEPHGLGLKFGHQDNTGADFKMQRNLQRGTTSVGENNFIKLEIPLHVQLRSNYKFINYANISKTLSMYRLYLLGGGKYGWHLNANKHYKEPENIALDNPSMLVRPNYVSLEVGLGLDLYFTYFKISPEIRFSESLGNLLDHDRNQGLRAMPGYNNPFMGAVDRLGLRSFHFSLILE